MLSGVEHVCIYLLAICISPLGSPMTAHSIFADICLILFPRSVSLKLLPIQCCPLGVFRRSPFPCQCKVLPPSCLLVHRSCPSVPAAENWSRRALGTHCTWPSLEPAVPRAWDLMVDRVGWTNGWGTWMDDTIYKWGKWTSGGDSDISKVTQFLATELVSHSENFQSPEPESLQTWSCFIFSFSFWVWPGLLHREPRSPSIFFLCQQTRPLLL